MTVSVLVSHGRRISIQTDQRAKRDLLGQKRAASLVRRRALKREKLEKLVHNLGERTCNLV